MTLYDYVGVGFTITLIAVFIKTVIGFHFPWETCECCKRKWREHKP